MEMEMEKVFRMNAGLGESSYAQNSTLFQKRGLEIVEPMLKEAILSMKMMVECKTVCIADLGCSSGPNAHFTAENITQTLKAKYMSAGIPVPQFQSVGGRSYFAAGVPGSFYGRLFPDKALHFVHSSFGLHWLSQVPAEILEKNSVTWNKGKIFCDGSKAVGEAYFRQYQKDFNAFLRARAEEMVGGGRMVLLLLGRTSSDPSDQGFMAFSSESLERSLHDLVSQGLIEEEKVDSFNVPMYCPCPEEASNEVAREGSFEIQRTELVKRSDTFTKEEMEAITGPASAKHAYGKTLAKQMRAVTESLLEYHFGGEIMDVLFDRYAEIMGKRLSEIVEYEKRGGILLLDLQRK